MAVVSQANVADVMATRVLSYFSFSSVMLFRTSSHTCGRWYLPIFLLRDGLFTLMYIASLISLIKVVLLSPHYSEIINSGIMTCDGSVVMYGGGVIQMLFKPFNKASG